MKKQLFFLALSLGLLAFSFTTTAQTVRRVNGDPAITGVNVYNTIQAAVDAANTDDVILIEPYGSGFSVLYNAAVVNKRLHFRGVGYFLQNPNLTFPLLPSPYAIVQSLEFSFGSEGSTIKSLEVNYMQIKDNNITLENVRVYGSQGLEISSALDPNDTSGATYSYGNNLKIRKSWISNIKNLNTLTTGLVANNSIIDNVASNFSFQSLEQVSFLNCLLGSLSVTNGIFTNCIFYSTIPANLQNTSSISYSIAVIGANNITSTQNNQNNVDWQDLIIDPSLVNNNGYEKEDALELTVTSLAKGAGLNGDDIGIYGGNNPYAKSGLSKAPIATSFNNSGVGSNSVSLSVSVSFKAN